MKRAALLLCTSLVLSACSGGGGTPKTTSSSNPVINQTPSGGSFTESAFTCPTSVPSAASVVRAGSARGLARRLVRRGGTASITKGTTDLAVSYETASLGRARAQMVARESAAGGSFVRETAFAQSGTTMRVVRTDAASAPALSAALRALPGVRSVGVTSLRRHTLSVSGPLLTNDPFFAGLGAGAPLYQSTANDGQWDKHVVRLEDAFAYSKANNGSGHVNANALGSSAVKIAIIDSGEDSTHPELSSKIAYKKCFITNPDNSQSTSNFETDPDGHGTSVTGVAAAATGNSLGFTGSGGAAQIYAYRVFPTPKSDDSCLNDDATSNADPQCTSISTDIISAIDDAVAQKVDVINLSVGGDACTTAGIDPDAAEGAAIANAIAAGIVVVAAAGNDGTTGQAAPALESPACDTGVIAVGATALSDGLGNSSNNTSGSATSPREYVASYSNAGSPSAAFASANAWGIVAPGGDPTSAQDADYLHWIDNIWTTDAEALDTSYEGECDADTATGTTTDCRLLIAGTSLASPAVAGAAALIIAANASYKSATKMKQLLCTTADDIGDTNEGCGRLDLYRAMSVAVGDTNEPATRPVP